jgi:hypothetical protein
MEGAHVAFGMDASAIEGVGADENGSGDEDGGLHGATAVAAHGVEDVGAEKGAEDIHDAAGAFAIVDAVDTEHAARDVEAAAAVDVDFERPGANVDDRDREQTREKDNSLDFLVEGTGFAEMAEKSEKPGVRGGAMDGPALLKDEYTQMLRSVRIHHSLPSLLPPPPPDLPEHQVVVGRKIHPAESDAAAGLSKSSLLPPSPDHPARLQLRSHQPHQDEQKAVANNTLRKMTSPVEERIRSPFRA